MKKIGLNKKILCFLTGLYFFLVYEVLMKFAHNCALIVYFA